MMGKHLCHARHCTVAVPPKMFMCKQHWYMLPKDMRDKVWALYRPGQERTKDPSMQYLEHTMACIRYVADKEFGNTPSEKGTVTQ